MLAPGMVNQRSRRRGAAYEEYRPPELQLGLVSARSKGPIKAANSARYYRMNAFLISGHSESTSIYRKDKLFLPDKLFLT